MTCSTIASITSTNLCIYAMALGKIVMNKYIFGKRLSVLGLSFLLFIVICNIPKSKNITNDHKIHKIYQMAVKRPNGHKIYQQVEVGCARTCIFYSIRPLDIKNLKN
jgi:hypothetical protein